jgi:hypothetical protein
MRGEVIGLNFEDERGTVVKFLVVDASAIGHEFGTLTLSALESKGTSLGEIHCYDPQVESPDLGAMINADATSEVANE